MKFIKKYLIWLPIFFCLSASLNSGIVQGAEQTDCTYTSRPVMINGIFQAQKRNPIRQRLDRSNTPDTSLSSSESNNNLKREITSEGMVRIYYPDGQIKELFDGGYKIIYPDGTEQIFSFHQVQPLIPPLPPDDSELEWLDGHAENLLSVMELMVGSASVNNYKQVESQKISDGNLYKAIGMRLLYIDRLLSL